MVVKVVGQLVVMPDERSITSGSFRRAAKFRRFEKLMVELIPQQSHITQDPQGLNTLTCSSKTLRPSAAGKKHMYICQWLMIGTQVTNPPVGPQKL